MIQYYAPGLPALAQLSPEESGHCVRVLRHKEGDIITCFDGRGKRYQCVITAADPRGVCLSVESATDVPCHWPCHITLAVAPTKNADRMEWLSEKAVEIGVNTLALLRCEHSERKILNPKRLERIMVSAAKQSLKTYVPELTEVTPLPEFLAAQAAVGGYRYFGYCDPAVPRRLLACETLAAMTADPSRPVCILIGPEGDFSPAEVRMALDAGFIPVSLGDSRLRTETAALSALQTLHTALQLRECPDGPQPASAQAEAPQPASSNL